MSEPLYFHDADGPLGELSNFYPLKTPIFYYGKDYPTSEHLYHAMKYLYKGAPEANVAYADEIRKASTPYKAKILANKRKAYRYRWQTELSALIDKYDKLGAKPRPDWEEEKVKKMEKVLWLKFNGDEHCGRVLLSTDGSDLVEHTPTDNFWGDGGANGLNWLGRLLVKVRKQMMAFSIIL